MNHLESTFTGKNSFWRYLVMFAAVFIVSNTIGALPLLIGLLIKSFSNPEIFSRFSANPNDYSIIGFLIEYHACSDVVSVHCRTGCIYTSCQTIAFKDYQGCHKRDIKNQVEQVFYLTFGMAWTFCPLFHFLSEA